MNKITLNKLRVKRKIQSPISNHLIVLGAMKSGTTTLFEYMSQHPQIAQSHRKELNFFSMDDKFARGARYYRSLWPAFDPLAHRYALEASPGYAKLRTETVARRIQDFGGDFRFIYIVRDPVDRIESHLAHNIAKGRQRFKVRKVPDRVIETSRYARQLDAFRAGFDDPRILILDFDELRRTPMATMERCMAFLDLEPSFRFNPIEPANPRKSVNRANEFRLDAEQRTALAARLRPDVIDFRDRYGFDVSGWGSFQ